MGKGTWLGPVLAGAAACSLAACGGETGILLDIQMSAALQDQLATNQADFDTLRIYVGQKTETAGFFTSASDAYASVDRDRQAMTDGYRYLVEPDGDLAAIGDMVFAAAVGDRPANSQPFLVIGFAVSGTPLGFVDGEVRVVGLTLEPASGVVTGMVDECIAWGTATGEPGRIAPADDQDCDTAVGAADCDDLDPSRNQLDLDHDGVTSCDGDCLELRPSNRPWLDPASVRPGASDETPDADTCDHVDNDCDGACGTMRGDTDQSGSTVCGKTAPASDAVCAVVPADCDENTAGNNVDGEGAAEACNGRDDACDGFLAPPIPCLYTEGPGQCRMGQVACDELRGTFEGEPQALACSDLPGGFSDLDLATTSCSSAAPYSPSCLQSPDPIGCSTFGQVGLSSVCTVNATNVAGSDCTFDRTVVNLPDTVLPQACAWTVVGGVDQAEWQIGFVEPGSGNTTPPTVLSDLCRPTLAISSRVLRPKARTVMLLLAGPGDPLFGVRPLLIHLQPGGDLCTGLATCTTPGG